MLLKNMGFLDIPQEISQEWKKLKKKNTMKLSENEGFMNKFS